MQEEQLKADKEKYLQLLLSYIDKGIPVISNLRIMGHPKWIVFVGYEEDGKTLLFMTDNMTEPERVSTKEFKANIPGCDPKSSELADEQNKKLLFRCVGISWVGRRN